MLECTGLFTEREDAEKHVRAPAPAGGAVRADQEPDVPTIVHGVNRPDGQTQIISCASCTTQQHHPAGGDPDRTSASRRPADDRARLHRDPGPGRQPRREGLRAAAAPPRTSSPPARRGHGHRQGAAGHAGSLRRGLVRGPVAVGSISTSSSWWRGHHGRRGQRRAVAEQAPTDRYQGVLGVAEDPRGVGRHRQGDLRASIVQLDRPGWLGATWSR